MNLHSTSGFIIFVYIMLTTMRNDVSKIITFLTVIVLLFIVATVAIQANLPPPRSIGKHHQYPKFVSRNPD